MKQRLRASVLCLMGGLSFLRAEVYERKPAATNPSEHAFPALGAGADRKVTVEWNRFYDTEGLGAILLQLNREFPQLTQLYSIGQSIGGRELWCLELTARQHGRPERKPAMYIDGNIHGNEVQGGEAVAYTAWYLCHQYGRLPKVTELVDRTTFYLLPTINPDGRDDWFHRAHNAHSSRSGVKPMDNDRDGQADEDGYDDLDGDGSICTMRIRDPHGRWKPHPQFPQYLMVAAGPDETGEYSMLGTEGLDNDGDGRINEDTDGGYDMNRNWAWDWQPNYVQGGAHEYPFSLPETRAVSRFVFDHPNIAAFQSYHNFGGMILRGPGREGGQIQGSDDRILQTIAQRGEAQLPFYRSMVIYKDLYTVWGGEVDWLYAGRGILGFTSELWNKRSLNKGPNQPSNEEEINFIKHLLLEDGLVAWHPYNHPTYGPIEIGGTKKEWGRTPPSFLLEEECHRNMAFTLYHADQMPLIKLLPAEIQPLAPDLRRIQVTIENQRLIPTRSEQDVRNHISPPDTVSLAGPDITVITAGIVRNRFRNEISAVKKRPERIELPTIPGLEAVRVQFIVRGTGPFTVLVESAKGGSLRQEGELR